MNEMGGKSSTRSDTLKAYFKTKKGRQHIKKMSEGMKKFRATHEFTEKKVN
jgi:hypothetical protein